MFQLTPDRTHDIVHFRLSGLVRTGELEQLGRELDDVGRSFQGKPIKLLVDLRGFVPGTPDVAEAIQSLQEAGLRAGVTRIAEVVESDVLALQLNRIARDSGTYGILRRFWEEEDARAWLIAGDPAG